MSRSAGVVLVVLVVLAVIGAAGCRHRSPAPRPGRSDPHACPPAGVLARMVAGNQQGRVTRADCVEYAPGFFWLGAALAFDGGTAAHPRLSLIYGGQPPSQFDLQPIPEDDLTRIIRDNRDDLRVSIRKPSPDSRLVRVGVYGQHGGDRPMADELVLVLRLVAHAPPEVLWVGPGDEVRTTAAGCVSERTVDFEMPFGDRLEMSTAQRAHVRVPGAKASCLAAPSTQQTVDYRPQPLKPGRAVEN
jgi:hypothetical protein